MLASKGRLIVPGQAAREFYKHRAKKLAEIVSKVDGAIKKAKAPIFDAAIPILDDDPDYKVAHKLASEIAKHGKKIAEKLAAVNKKLQDDIGSDPISTMYRSVLSNCVFDLEIDPEFRTELVAECQYRARFRIAPGYEDQNKPDGGIGDLLIWKTILREGANRKVHCIFVTNEEKPDWWIKKHGTFQPRPELIEEYRRASGGASFHMLPLSGLLAAFQASVAVIEETQKLEENKRTPMFSPSELAIKHWTNQKNPKTFLEWTNDAPNKNLRIDLIRKSLMALSNEIDSESDFKNDKISDNDFDDSV